jgi:hypothetical protein
MIIMVKKNEEEYGQDVYRRLELVRKQFQKTTAGEKRLEPAGRRRRILSYFQKNQDYLIRMIVFTALAALVVAVIVILVTR